MNQTNAAPIQGIQFEIAGYFEELFSNDPQKCIGSRNIQPGTRKLGTDGREDIVIMQPFNVERGGKVHRIEASAAKPFIGWSMVQAICGRAKWKHPMDV